MTSDDNHDDDAQLQQLRAVWVTMRDEDPPDRGLAALMAAARTKAAELEQAASPSWWQRIAATLRRPPVLALATVTLLLGGALIVTQRSSEMKVEETASDERLETNDVQTKGDYASPMAGSAATVDRGIQAPADPQVAPPAEPVATPGAERSKNVDAKPVVKPKSKAVPAGPTGQTAPPPPPPPPPTEVVAPDVGATSAGGAAPPRLSIAQDDSETADADVAKSAKKPIARKAAPSIEGEDRVTKDSAKPTLDQLVKQCETAAARGDCAAVRAIAQKILTTAPAAYKSRVTSNAAINRCMPDTAPNAAAAE